MMRFAVKAKWLPFQILSALALLLLALRLTPHAGLLDGQPWSRAVYAADGQLLRLSLAEDQQYRLRTPLSEMAPVLRRGRAAV